MEKRITEVFENGEWIQKEGLKDLKVGDVFRMFNDQEKKDIVSDSKTGIPAWICLTSPSRDEERGEGYYKCEAAPYVINSILGQ